MQNKFIHCIVLFFTFPLVSSEAEILAAKQRMIVKTQVNNQYIQNYEIRAIRSLNIKKSALIKEEDTYPFLEVIDKSNIRDIGNVKLSVQPNEILIQGNAHCFYDMVFTDDSLANFKKELKNIRERSLADKDFMVFLVNKDVTEGISFSLTEQQYELITQQFYGSKIAVVFGIAGLVALFYYFGYSKGMALLGRG